MLVLYIDPHNTARLKIEEVEKRGWNGHHDRTANLAKTR
jgi:hypothetical protein